MAVGRYQHRHYTENTMRWIWGNRRWHSHWFHSRTYPSSLTLGREPHSPGTTTLWSWSWPNPVPCNTVSESYTWSCLPRACTRWRKFGSTTVCRLKCLESTLCIWESAARTSFYLLLECSHSHKYCNTTPNKLTLSDHMPNILPLLGNTYPSQSTTDCRLYRLSNTISYRWRQSHYRHRIPYLLSCISTNSLLSSIWDRRSDISISTRSMLARHTRGSLLFLWNSTTATVLPDILPRKLHSTIWYNLILFGHMFGTFLLLTYIYRGLSIFDKQDHKLSNKMSSSLILFGRVLHNRVFLACKVDRCRIFAYVKKNK